MLQQTHLTGFDCCLEQEQGEVIGGTPAEFFLGGEGSEGLTLER